MKDKSCPIESKPLFSSKKFRIACLFLVIAIVMQWLGKFDENFANFLMWFGSSTVFSFSVQDVSQATAKAKSAAPVPEKNAWRS